MRDGLGGGQDGEPTRVRVRASLEVSEPGEVGVVVRRDVDPSIVIRRLVQVVQRRILVAPAIPVSVGVRAGHRNVLGVVGVVGAERVVLLVGQVRLRRVIVGRAPVVPTMVYIAITNVPNIVVRGGAGLRLFHEMGQQEGEQ